MIYELITFYNEWISWLLIVSKDFFNFQFTVEQLYSKRLIKWFFTFKYDYGDGSGSTFLYELKIVSDSIEPQSFDKRVTIGVETQWAATASSVHIIAHVDGSGIACLGECFLRKWGCNHLINLVEQNPYFGKVTIWLSLIRSLECSQYIKKTSLFGGTLSTLRDVSSAA